MEEGIEFKTNKRIEFKGIKEICEEYGVENILIMAPVKILRRILFISYTTSNDDSEFLPCTINEKRYKIDEGYKLTIVPLDDRYTTKHYYQSDFDQIVRQGHIEVYIKTHKEED